MTMQKFSYSHTKVAPLVGAWIEIINMRTNGKKVMVAPLVGAWIEIARTEPEPACKRSLLL